MKIKQKPCEKIHRRYLLISGANKTEIEKAILESVGILGWAKAAPLFVNAKNTENAVLAVRRESLEDIRAGFEISEFKGKIERVSGTIKGIIKNLNKIPETLASRML